MKEKVKEIGSLFVVDPNPPGGDGLEQIPPEDLFIYVKFSATPRSRQIYDGVDSNGDPKISSSGVADEVNFISTEIKYNSDGNIEVPEGQETVDSYATTNWSDIGGLGNSKSGGILEGFGIKSIEIKYNASLVPVVDITFTDVRGAGLFDTIKDNDRLSPYSLFFKMPYPIFKLSVKGYFGQTVEYCLHMVNWTSNFDGSTGNFEISANFLGFQQAFLNDMNIGNIIANVNTKEGRKQLDLLNWTYTVGDGDDAQEFTIKEDIRKLDDFFLIISRLQINVDNLKSKNADELDTLKDLNGQIKLLKQIRGFIGAPLTKSSKEDSTKEDNYLKKENIEDSYRTETIRDTILNEGENLLSIRDYLIINSINESAYKGYIDTLTSIISQYNDFVKNQELTDRHPNAEALFSDSFQTVESPTSPIFLKYVRSETKSTDSKSIDPMSVKGVRDEMLKTPDTNAISLSLFNNYGTDKKQNNIHFDIIDFKSKYKFYTDTMTPDTNCFVVDFREQRATLENLIQVVETDIKKQREDVNKLINGEIIKNFKEKYGFNPTIENCFRILSNNTQALTATIYEITRLASDKKLKDKRKRSLKNFNTDIPEEVDSSVAWPAVYRTNDTEGDQEIYLGEIPDSSPFPEKSYIDSIFESLVARTKTIQQVTRANANNESDTDNWFPINPIDYDVNPFRVLNDIDDDVEMKNILANRIFLRVATLKNYSLFNNTNGAEFYQYAEMDAINANLSVFAIKSRAALKILIENIKNKPELLNDTEFFKSNINKGVTDFTIKNDGPDNYIGGEKIGGRESGVDFIDLSDNTNIIDNSKSLWQEIKNYDAYKKIISTEDTNKINIKTHTDKFIKQKYTNSNLVSQIGYNVWDKDVSANLYKTSESLIYTVKDVSDIDITATTSEGKGKYINRTNFYTKDKTPCNYEKFMIDSDLYTSQSSKYAKALLLLSTLPFKTFKEAVLDVVFDGKYAGARIIELPKYYIYLIGGYLWRYRNDGINWNINYSGNTNCPYNIFSNTKEEYLTNLGYLATTDKKGQSLPIEPELLELPNHTQDIFIKQFTNWVTNDFEGNVTQYRNIKTVDETEINKATKWLKVQFNLTTKMIVFAPKIFDTVNKLPEELIVKESDIQKYITSFSNKFTKLNEKNTTGDSEEEVDKVAEEKRVKEIKLAIYKYFKNVNDKWVSDTEKSFSVCGSNSTEKSKDLIDYFKFIDKGWGDIGQKAVFNLNSLLSLSSNLKTSMYLFMSKILRDSNFLFQILPTYINFKDATEVAKIFQPITTIENNKSSGPIYACIYIGGASKVLDIKERNNYYFKNDGFSFPNPSVENDPGNLPVGFSKKGKFSQVAFRVAFGAENQTIFKNVSLNQQEHKETGEYFKALSDLVDKRGGTQKTYQGTDLYKLYDTRSYTCKIDALGCMNIQPLMYFDLQNVPFFKGAYLITNVNHSISPNHMTTNFQGVRQSKFITPAPTEITTDLNLNLDESTDIPVLKFQNDNRSDKDIYVIGVLNPTDGFDFEKFNVGYFKKMGVNTDLLPNAEANIKLFAAQLKSAKILSNKQVCMIMGNILTVSNNMINLSKPTKNPALIHDIFPDYETIYSGSPKYYGVNPPPSSSPFYEDFKNADSNSISALTPTFSTVTINYEVMVNPSRVKTPAEIINDGNIYPSDEHFFTPKGYLYVKGRQEYFDILPKKWNKPDSVATTPAGAFQVAIDVWQKKKISKDGKTAFEWVNEGTGGANDYTKTVEIVNGQNQIRPSFLHFEKVLLAFNLKDDFLK